MPGKKVVVGITGASGSILAVRLLKELRDEEIHLVMSDNSKKVIKFETGMDPSELESRADFVYQDSDVGARVSSGSFIFDAYVIVPCSISTLSKIAAGISDSLITRVASVALKERRRFVIVPRETPLSSITLENMLKLSVNGVLVLPFMPGFYTKPRSVDDMVNFVISRLLDAIGVENKISSRWEGLDE
ncbi:MAG: UbiX family flavin prenyltransferase [Candidatus Thermoplasmatota archaeon]|nr:UbiX family flavin prenyltransferase [Candidatus Thermoplasmatota archaeon]